MAEGQADVVLEISIHRGSVDQDIYVAQICGSWSREDSHFTGTEGQVVLFFAQLEQLCEVIGNPHG